MSSGDDLLKVEKLKKYFTGSAGFKKLVLDDINFSFNSSDRGKIITILAPFGSGKSTLLKIISALEQPSEGKVLLNWKEYNSPNSSIIYIPEKPSSFPWYNVKENIQFAAGSNKDNAVNNINNLISVVGLSGYEDHFPHNKSLGFRFRISLARALSLSPKIILIDDSFKNIDGETRNEIYGLMKNISEELKINFLMATTNIHEAIFLSDKILLMKKDPGNIFKEIELDRKVDKNFIVTGEIIEMRNRIESYFREENNFSTINFSI